MNYMGPKYEKRKEVKSMNIWNEEFYKEGRGSEDPIFRIPHKDLPTFVRLLKEQNAQNILDLGCGTGRHVIALSKEGFKVYGLDVAEKAVERTKQWLIDEGLDADVRTGNMYQSLPYQDDFFDGAVSIKAMHHALIADIQQLISELKRVMRRGSLLMIEVPKKDPKRYPVDKEVEPGTIVFNEGPEKDVPHHIFESRDELKNLFAGFEILDIHETGGDQMGTPSLHFTMLARLL